MSAPLPPGLDPSDEIEISWKRGKKHTKVIATLGGATFTVKTDDESASLVPWLVASANQILEAAYAAIEASEKDDEP